MDPEEEMNHQSDGKKGAIEEDKLRNIEGR